MSLPRFIHIGLLPFAALAAETADLTTATIPTHRCIQDDSETLVRLRQLESQQLTIGTITFEQLPIFDESKAEENNWLFRWINRVHVNTRESVIGDDLLFKTGEPVDATKVIESERLLRRRSYLREPLIQLVGDCATQADIKVSAREVWTLIPQVGYSHKGGENNSMFGIKDKNIFGSGKELSAQYEKNTDFTRRYLAYKDPNWGNHHGILAIQYGQTDEGDYHRFNIERPFFSLDTEWAGGLTSSRIVQTRKVYFRGEPVQAFEHEMENVETYYGLSSGLTASHVNRLSIGVAQSSDRFVANDETIVAPAMPDDRDYRYPFIRWDYIDANFIKTKNVNQINVTEDYNLGWQFETRIGFSSNQLGNSRTATLFNLNAQRTFIWGEDKLLFGKATVDGIYQRDDYVNTISDVQLRYHQGDFEHSQFYLATRLRHGHGLTTDQWLYLGGDNGLRGYPMRYQVGERSALLTAEWRWFTDYELFHLADVGFAAFYDVGRAWFHDHDNGVNGGRLRNAGIGVRLAPTRIGGEIRSGESTVIHIDLAIPLDAREDVGRYQWLVQAKQSF